MTSFEISREADPVMAKEIRDVVPAHYVLKIKSFSLFAENNMEKYESSEFEAGGYKWKLILYPNGDKSRKGEDHISIYLAISGINPLQLGPIHVAVRFSLYDQICDRYLTEQGRVTRFHTLRAEWGVPRYMPLKTFTDPSNGYLVDDTCVLGVEVFVIKSSGVGECFTLKKSASYTFQWNIYRLPSLGEDYLYSDVFTVGDHKWKVWLCPRGDYYNRGQSLSVYLILVEADKLASGQKVNARCVIRLKGPYYFVHQPEPWTRSFSSSTTLWGWPTFMPLKMVWERLTNDPCLLEAEVTVLGTTSKLP
ncbi:hypothetical protein BT93_C1686 [Corymbia citriodora subsp. variegata]|nr:hypothetical protein BT93_C1686 [Corymbia citriodora subsp. variegata]